MVAKSDPKKGRAKEVGDAQAAKKKVDPDVRDPEGLRALQWLAAYMPNIDPQTGDGKKPAKSSSKKAAPKASVQGGVRLDPDLPLIPGNSPTFVAEERPGKVLARISTSRGVSWVNASNGQGDARVSKILEVPGVITVEFYENGKAYASGTWTVK